MANRICFPAKARNINGKQIRNIHHFGPVTKTKKGSLPTF
jgi:hypothetical protein